MVVVPIDYLVVVPIGYLVVVPIGYWVVGHSWVLVASFVVDWVLAVHTFVGWAESGLIVFF